MICMNCNNYNLIIITMNKAAILLLSMILVITGCDNVLAPAEEPREESSFNWTTVKSEDVILSESSDIFDQYGDTIATNLPAGTYDLKVGANVVLSVVSAGATKADAGASVISFPAAGKYATVMAEDVYPYMGDYDFNDVVFGLRIDFVMNPGTDKVVTVKFNILPLGAGSSYEKLGIAAFFRGAVIAPYFRDAVVGTPDDYTDLFFYKIEASDNGLVFPLTGNLRNHFSGSGAGAGFVNTQNFSEYYPGVPFTVSVNIGAQSYGTFDLFGSDVSKSIVDVFVVAGERGREIHFKGQKASSFNTVSANGVTDYQKDGYVWMVMADVPVHYPVEYVNIQSAYPDFTSWVKSLGTTDADWYERPAVPFDASLVSVSGRTDGNLVYGYDGE